MSVMNQAAPAQGAPPTIGTQMMGGNKAGETMGAAPGEDNSGPPIRPGDPCPWMPSHAMATFAQLANFTLAWRMKPTVIGKRKVMEMAQGWANLRLAAKRGGFAAAASGASGAGGGPAPAGPQPGAPAPAGPPPGAPQG